MRDHVTTGSRATSRKPVVDELMGQIPGKEFVDLTAPRAQEESYVGDFVPDDEHDECSYGEHSNIRPNSFLKGME